MSFRLLTKLTHCLYTEALTNCKAVTDVDAQNRQPTIEVGQPVDFTGLKLLRSIPQDVKYNRTVVVMLQGDFRVSGGYGILVQSPLAF